MKIRRETVFALTYTAMMAIAMLVSYHAFGLSYGNPEIVRTLLYFEALMTAYALWILERTGFSYSPQPLAFSPEVAIYGFMILLVAAIYMKERAYMEYELILLEVLGTNFLVGVSEELMYRKIVLGLTMEREGRLRAILKSSILFSLLHAVNILGGMEASAMCLQLFSTFIYGILSASAYASTGTIIPFIVFHVVWDDVMSSPLFAERHIALIAIVMVLEVLLSISLMMRIIISERQKRLA